MRVVIINTFFARSYVNGAFLWSETGYPGIMDRYQEAWESLYSGQSRPWRGVADIAWMSVSAGDRVLDLGCGNGKTSAALIERGADVTGIDFSPSAVESCKRIFGEKGTFLEADVRSLPFADGSFDIVVSVHVIEHVPESDISKASEEIVRVLRTGGTLYLRCFAEGDMRSEGKREDVRNGILYRYFTEDDIRTVFPTMEVISLDRTEKPTRFGTVRCRLQAVLRRQ